MGITASPIAAAAAVFMATAADNNLDIGLHNVLMVTIPATLIGLLVACTWSLNRGKDLDKDPEFQARCQDVKNFCNGLIDPEAEVVEGSSEDKKAKTGLLVFMLGIASVIFVAMFGKELGLLPNGVNMSVAIQFLMLSVGAIILLTTNIQPSKSSTVMLSLLVRTAVIIIFGIALAPSDTITAAYQQKTF
ncbi:anaerobic C4-dicarboxylate transporter family protein [Vibrio metschnikovii]